MGKKGQKGLKRILFAFWAYLLLDFVDVCNTEVNFWVGRSLVSIDFKASLHAKGQCGLLAPPDIWEQGKQLRGSRYLAERSACLVVFGVGWGEKTVISSYWFSRGKKHEETCTLKQTHPSYTVDMGACQDYGPLFGTLNNKMAEIDVAETGDFGIFDLQIPSVGLSDTSLPGHKEQVGWFSGACRKLLRVKVDGTLA